MSLIDYIFLGIILLGIVTILFIVVRKFPVISKINPKSARGQQQKDMKKDLLEQRLNRKFKDIFSKLNKVMMPVSEKMKGLFRIAYKKVTALEHYYSQKIQSPQKDEDKIKTRSKINQLQQEAEDLRKDNQFKESEKKYIEAISLNRDNPEAFALLGELYMENKEYEYAHETFSHLLRIDPDNAQVYHDLGTLAKIQDNNPLAIKNFEKALEIEPNNPKILDSLIESSLETKDKMLAWEAYDKLKQVNPENQKIAEFKEKIIQLEQELKIKK